MSLTGYYYTDYLATCQHFFLSNKKGTVADAFIIVFFNPAKKRIF